MELISAPFVWRRLHSLMGLFIVLFLIEHLITNSQAALLIGENGAGFIRAVNFIKNLPYLPVIELLLIGVPIGYHAALGIKYAISGRPNSVTTSGASPSLPQYGRNQAYTWQRLTSWILLIGIIGHVAYMRFYLYPTHAVSGVRSAYFVRVHQDDGLEAVAKRLGVHLYNEGDVDREVRQLRLYNDPYEEEWVRALAKRPVRSGEVIAESDNFGTVTLLNVRNSFQNIWTCILYTIFVVSAVFHAFNGLWTFMITWGIVIRMRSQKQSVNVCIGLMLLLGFLGLASVWGTYWINLRG
jgi:succinate dehydrogenase / fumarate reductase cytochrome b subunit